MEQKNKQTIANKKWQDKNKEYTKYLNYRSRARTFIKNLAKKEDVQELEKLLSERKEFLDK
jgi:ribosomal protein S20